VQCWQAHSLEAWVARKNAGSEHMVLTGADDACFKGCVGAHTFCSTLGALIQCIASQVGHTEPDPRVRGRQRASQRRVLHRV
jgi:hypothetical protein